MKYRMIKEAITTNSAATAELQATSVQLEQLPEHARADFFGCLARDYLKKIEDPENRKRYTELGQAYLERMAARYGLSRPDKPKDSRYYTELEKAIRERMAMEHRPP